MEEATGAPSSFAVWDPKRLRASGRDGQTVMTEPPSPLRMLLSRHTKRREFITLVGGVVTWPVMARGQQSERMRRVGVLQVQPETDADFRSWRMLFAARLRELGWINGKNLQIDY